jgi:hypothetical protein
MEACYGGTGVMERSCAVARGIDNTHPGKFSLPFFAREIFVLRPHSVRPLRRDLFPNSHEVRSS